MPKAFVRAIQGLSLNLDSMSPFGTAQTRAGGFNPISVLTNIVYGSNRLGSINFSTHPVGWGVAETRPAGLFPIPGLAGKVRIFINQIAGYGFWNNGDTLENADTLLHELGHAFNDVRGAGGFALPNWAEKNDPFAFRQAHPTKMPVISLTLFGILTLACVAWAEEHPRVISLF